MRHRLEFSMKLMLLALTLVVSQVAIACGPSEEESIYKLLVGLCSESGSRVISRVKTAVTIGRQCSSEIRIYTASSLVVALGDCHSGSTVSENAKTMATLCDRDVPCAQALIQSLLEGSTCNKMAREIVEIIKAIETTAERSLSGSVKLAAVSSITAIMTNECHTTTVVEAAERAIQRIYSLPSDQGSL